MNNTGLSTPISKLGRVGAKTAVLFNKLGIHTCKDLLFYFPFRFDDFSHVIPISEATAGTEVTIRARIQLVNNRRSARTRKIVTEAIVADDSGSIRVVWFNQPYLMKNLAVGDEVYLSGKTSDHFLDLQLTSPVYEKIYAHQETLHTARLVPIYSLTGSLTQKQFRTVLGNAIARFGDEIEEWIPADIIAHEQLPGRVEALRAIHFPENKDQCAAATLRMKFEELFRLQVYSAQQRSQLLGQKAYAVALNTRETDAIFSRIPFTLTGAQKQALKEIMDDIEKSHPMNRLLEGDVGSGKTVVASVIAAIMTLAGYQSAIMAPTEILAQQHYQSLLKFLGPMGITCAIITGSQAISSVSPVRKEEESQKKVSKQKERQAVYDQVEQGEVNVVIGTHALIQERMKFFRLGFAVVDEQHRFGVNQRKALREKNPDEEMPHLLSMTATPIPRSLALTLYGDLDVSILNELPQGRLPIITKVVPNSYREWTYDFIKQQIHSGRQVFIICPLIDPSDTLGYKSVKEEFERLSRDIFPGFTMGMLHGKMKPVEKEAVMRTMVEGSIQILVATSVVEVGVDIPNATVMLIEGADRFGLAQLHQFRGRVGRGADQSYCFLMPGNEEKESTERLAIVASCTDGFVLAEKDLELRGSGDILGTVQSGMPTLAFATLHDTALIQKAHAYARDYIGRINEFPEMKEEIASFAQGVHLE